MGEAFPIHQAKCTQETHPAAKGERVEETHAFRCPDKVEQLEDPSVLSEIEENGDERMLPPSPSLHDDKHAEYQCAQVQNISVLMMIIPVCQ